MMKAERIVDCAKAFEWAEALRQCWAGVFFDAAEDLRRGSRGLENQAIRTCHRDVEGVERRKDTFDDMTALTWRKRKCGSD